MVLLAHGLIVLLPLVSLPVAVIHQKASVPVAVAIPVAVKFAAPASGGGGPKKIKVKCCTQK